MMIQEIINKFIEAEKKEGGIVKVFDEYFSEFQKDYEKMAQLMLSIDDRIEFYLGNEEMSLVYVELKSKISAWSNESLDTYEYDDFCRLADNYCIEKDFYES